MSNFIESSIIERETNFRLPKSDDRKFRGLILKNELTVFLVSDPESKMSGCCLSVKAGAMQSPENLDGLAHFLEHMLFCGTKKYPDATDYKTYITENGGHRQGYTTRGYTTYYFEVKNEAFKGALDRFSSFFTCPIISPSMAEKEVNAIQNEFQLKYYDDDRVKYHMSGKFAVESHPIHKFTTGNKETLETIPKYKNIDVYEELLKFYDKYYSSNIMCALLYGNEDLDQLEEYAVEYFFGIQNKKVETIDYIKLYHENPPYTKDTVIGKIAKVIPYKQDKKLSLIFPMPSVVPYFSSSAASYISHIIDHQGEGSIFSALRDRGLATNVSFLIIDNDEAFATAQFTVILTEDGYTNICLVVKIILNFVELFKANPIVPDLVEEFIHLCEADFMYSVKLPVSTLFSIPMNFLKYRCALKDIMAANWIVEEFNNNHVLEILKYINKKNFYIYLIAPDIKSEYEKNPGFFEIEHHYNVKYKVTEFDDSMKHIIDSASVENARQLGLELPKRNPFISTDFTIYNEQTPGINDFDRLPHLLNFDKYKSELRRFPAPKIWFKSDTVFGLPQSVLNFRILATNIACIELEDKAKFLAEFDNLPYTLVFQVFGNILEETIRRTMHQYKSDIAAASLSFKCSFNARHNVLALQVSGFSHKVPVLMSLVLNLLYENVITEREYNEAVIIIDRQWTNKILQSKLYPLAIDKASEAIIPTAFSRKELLGVLKIFTYQEFIILYKHFLTSSNFEGLILGNLTDNMATEVVMDNYMNIIKYKQAHGCDIKSHKVEPFSAISLNENIYIDQILQNETDRNGSWLCLFQIGASSNETQIKINILDSYLSSEIFHELRTKKQLVYVATSLQMMTCPIQVFGYYIQSSEYMNSFILKELLDFQFNKVISGEVREKFTKELFNTYLDSQIQKYSSWPKNIYDEITTYIKEINEKSFQFDHRNLKINLLKSLKYDDFMNFYDSCWTSPCILVELKSQVDSEKQGDSDLTQVPLSFKHISPIYKLSRDESFPKISIPMI
ncbi:putative insulinase [Cryptosporidium serpentis]